MAAAFRNVCIVLYVKAEIFILSAVTTNYLLNRP